MEWFHAGKGGLSMFLVCRWWYGHAAMHLFRNAEMPRLAFTTGQESERIVKSWERNDLMTMMFGIHTKMVSLMCFHTWRCNYKIVVCTELILESDFFASKIQSRAAKLRWRVICPCPEEDPPSSWINPSRSDTRVANIRKSSDFAYLMTTFPRTVAGKFIGAHHQKAPDLGEMIDIESWILLRFDS